MIKWYSDFAQLSSVSWAIIDARSYEIPFIHLKFHSYYRGKK